MGVRLSIVVPTVGRHTLGRTLRSIEQAPGDEVLLVGDGDPPLARGALARHGLSGRYIPRPGAPPRDWGMSARNLAMPLARGDWLLFMDDDDAYAPGAFAQLRRALPHSRAPQLFKAVDVVAGRMMWGRSHDLALGNVTTQMVAVPAGGRWGRWGDRYSGDHDFIAETCGLWPAGEILWWPMVVALLWPAWDV